MARVNKVYIGDFKDSIHAAMAYDIWAKEDEHNYLNFPNAIWKK